jgi:hypothetical protein
MTTSLRAHARKTWWVVRRARSDVGTNLSQPRGSDPSSGAGPRCKVICPDPTPFAAVVPGLRSSAGMPAVPWWAIVHDICLPCLPRSNGTRASHASPAAE